MYTGENIYIKDIHELKHKNYEMRSSKTVDNTKSKPTVKLRYEYSTDCKSLIMIYSALSIKTRSN